MHSLANFPVGLRWPLFRCLGTMCVGLERWYAVQIGVSGYFLRLLLMLLEAPFVLVNLLIKGFFVIYFLLGSQVSLDSCY